MSREKIPVVILNPSSKTGYAIFNSNHWTGASKSVIQSCAAHLNLIIHINDGLKSLQSSTIKTKQAESLKLIKEQWSIGKWPVDNCIFYIEIPQLHMYVQALFASGKTFLDIIVQLLSSEGVVKNNIDGFHKDNQIIGGKLLNMLDRNASNKVIAQKAISLLNISKKAWMDNFITSRDLLVHPSKGFGQVAISFDMIEQENEITISKMNYPRIDDLSIFEYGDQLVKHISDFSRQFIEILKNK